MKSSIEKYLYNYAEIRNISCEEVITDHKNVNKFEFNDENSSLGELF